MQKPHTDKKFYELGVKELLATKSEVVKTLSGRFGIYNMGSDHGLVIFERWY